MGKKRERKWTAEEDAFIRSRLDWSAKKVGEALSRSSDAVRMRKVRLRHLDSGTEPRRAGKRALRARVCGALKTLGAIGEGTREPFHLLAGPEEEEFVLAVLRFRGKYHRAPSLIEGFRIAKAIGWTKQ
jgi:hypothetical protein